MSGSETPVEKNRMTGLLEWLIMMPFVFLLIGGKLQKWHMELEFNEFQHPYLVIMNMFFFFFYKWNMALCLHPVCSQPVCFLLLCSRPRLRCNRSCWNRDRYSFFFLPAVHLEVLASVCASVDWLSIAVCSSVHIYMNGWLCWYYLFRNKEERATHSQCWSTRFYFWLLNQHLATCKSRFQFLFRPLG